MKRVLLVVVVAILTVIYGFDMSAAVKRVAVVVTGNITGEQKSMINSAIMDRLSGNKEYKVFERNDAFVKSLEKEHDFQLGGIVPESEIRKIDEKSGADYVIVVNAVITPDDECVVSGRLIDLVSYEVLKTCTAVREFEGSSTLSALANNVAYRLLNKKSK